MKWYEVVIVAAIAAFLAVVFYAGERNAAACAERGGVAVRGASFLASSVCVSKEVVK